MFVVQSLSNLPKVSLFLFFIPKINKCVLHIFFQTWINFFLQDLSIFMSIPSVRVSAYRPYDYLSGLIQNHVLLM